jgi:hypothetical protein
MPSVEGVDDNLPSRGFGVHGESWRAGYGVRGFSLANHGVSGQSDSRYGVFGRSYGSYGVYGHSDNSIGVCGTSYGTSDTAFGVFGTSPNIGVYGGSFNGNGVYGRSSNGYGVYGTSSSGLAAYLNGNVTITGTLQKGGGAFKIDHPLDPANKYLSHSFVESPDMKNVYDGIVVLDRKGKAEIDLPNWFGALNKDFRYQLTAIGAPGPNLYIAEEISDKTTNYTSNKNNNSRFKIAGVLQV